MEKLKENTATLPLINISGLTYKKKEWIGIQSPPLDSLNKIIRTFPDRYFSYTLKLWLVPFSKENYHVITKQLQNIAHLNNSAFKQYLQEKKELLPQKVKSVEEHKKQIQQQAIALPNDFKIHAVNKKILPQVQQHLQFDFYQQLLV